MGDASVNGDFPHSAVLEHLTSYPIVSDSVTYFKENPYGAKSIELTNAGYAKFVKPTFPYLQTPAAYAKPYVIKADELGDKFLTKFDEKVPVVKSESEEIKGTVLTYISWPLDKATAAKDWAFDTYSSEYKKCGGDGYVAGGKAALTTPLILSSEVLQWLSSFLSTKKDEYSVKAEELKSELLSKKEELKGEAKAKASEAKSKKEEAKSTVQEKASK